MQKRSYEQKEQRTYLVAIHTKVPTRNRAADGWIDINTYNKGRLIRRYICMYINAKILAKQCILVQYNFIYIALHIFITIYQNKGEISTLFCPHLCLFLNVGSSPCFPPEGRTICQNKPVAIFICGPLAEPFQSQLWHSFPSGFLHKPPSFYVFQSEKNRITKIQYFEVIAPSPA